MREEYELEVLDRYDIEVRSTRKIRGAFFCDTDEGTMLLKETKISGQRAPLLYMVLNCLEERGNVHTRRGTACGFTGRQAVHAEKMVSGAGV